MQYAGGYESIDIIKNQLHLYAVDHVRKVKELNALLCFICRVMYLSSKNIIQLSADGEITKK